MYFGILKNPLIVEQFINWNFILLHVETSLLKLTEVSNYD